MPRIHPIDPANASPEQKQLLANVTQAMGVVPNLVATMAHSPALANAYLAFNKALSKGVLTSQMREKTSLAVGQANECVYCLAAHSAIAAKVVEELGRVSDEDVAGLRGASWTDAEITEILGNTALNIFTNYFNQVASPEADSPAAPKLDACACSH